MKTPRSNTKPTTDEALMRLIKLLEWCQDYLGYRCELCVYYVKCEEIYDEATTISSTRWLTLEESKLFWRQIIALHAEDTNWLKAEQRIGLSK